MNKKLDTAIFLEKSPYEADMGHLIGKDPRQIPVADIRQLEPPTSPIKAIRAKCLDCCGGSAAEARKCVSIKCALWPYRMGGSPFHGSSASMKREMSNIDASCTKKKPGEAATSTELQSKIPVERN